MKIAIFTDTFLPQINGVTNTLSKMKDYMDQRDIEYMFMIPGDISEKEQLQNIISFQSARFFLYPECRLTFPNYLEVAKQMDEFEPDLIHVATEFSLGMMGLKYARKNKITVTASYHTDFPGYMDYYGLPFLKPTVWNFLLWFHSFAFLNFAPSKHTANQLIDKGMENVRVWGRGIDINKYSPEFYSKEVREDFAQADELLLLYVGRIAPEKELNVLMEAAEILDRKNISYTLLMVGDGPSRKLFEEKKLPNVKFLGYKSGNELQNLYSSSDIFVFPSRSETYGNVILEAMASGLPVVSVLEGGVKENLIEGYNGIACEPGSGQSFADGIEKFVKNESLRRQMSQNARNHADRMDWNTVFDQLFNEFELLVENETKSKKKMLA